MESGVAVVGHGACLLMSATYIRASMLQASCTLVQGMFTTGAAAEPVLLLVILLLCRLLSSASLCRPWPAAPSPLRV